MKKRYSKLICGLIGLFSALAVFFIFGILTDVIKNDIYTRMVPASAMDLFFLISISLLLGIYAGLTSYILFNKKKEPVSTGWAFGGTMGGFFSVSCPICIQFLVWLFGAAFLLTYYDPLRPVIGILSIGLISFGIYNSILIIINKCDTCKTIKTP